MRTSRLVRAGAFAAASSLLALSATPAYAADPVAQATATGLSVHIAGQGTDTGTYRVVNDGTAETSSGTNQPALSLLQGQQLASVGTIAQDAVTAVVNGDGTSAACAGIAGQGATLVAAGNGRCLSGGNAVGLNVANLDLSNVQLSPQLPAELTGPLGLLLDPVLTALGGALQQVVGALGSPGVYVNLGAVQATCTASPGGATGYANIANAGVYVEVPGQGRVDIVSFPAEPAPNTKVVTGLDKVVTVVLNALRTQLNQGLGGIADPLNVITDQLQAQLVDTVLAQVAPQLAPLEQNVLDATLNKQSGGGNFIDVTALDLQVLPAARQFIDTSLVDLKAGRVTCGPNGRVAAAAAPPARPKVKTPKKNPIVPTSVPAGAADGSQFGDEQSPLGLAALGGLAVLATAAGVAGFRRALRP